MSISDATWLPSRALRIHVVDQAAYVRRVRSRARRWVMRIDLACAATLLTVPEPLMKPEILLAEIEARAGRTWPR